MMPEIQKHKNPPLLRNGISIMTSTNNAQGHDASLLIIALCRNEENINGWFMADFYLIIRNMSRLNDNFIDILWRIWHVSIQILLAQRINNEQSTKE